MKDWNGKNVDTAVSKGGVIALANPYENLIDTSLLVWPPAEITQKLYKSRQELAFSGRDHEVCSSHLGYYCDLQSIHSEDAITWSVFGTLVNAPNDIKSKWLTELLKLIDNPGVSCSSVQLSLWRRLPHPDTLTAGGPEIDICITTENAVILCEAKWLSKVGRNQGKLKDKNQIQLRAELLEKYGSIFFPDRTVFVVLGIGLSIGSITDQTHDRVVYREITWENLCNIKHHPLHQEVTRYYEWKYSHSRK